MHRALHTGCCVDVAELDLLFGPGVNLYLLHGHVWVHVGHCEYRLRQLLSSTQCQQVQPQVNRTFAWLIYNEYDSPLMGSGKARVNEGSRSFTCHARVLLLQME